MWYTRGELIMKSLHELFWAAIGSVMSTIMSILMLCMDVGDIIHKIIIGIIGVILLAFGVCTIILNLHEIRKLRYYEEEP